MPKKKFLQLIIIILCGFFTVSLFVDQIPARAQLNIQDAPSASGSFLLSWSADSYVPPDYAGKALPAHGGYIKVVAVPTKILPMNPDKYTYRWLLDGDVMGWASGQGKATFIFQVNKWPGASYQIEAQILDSQEKLVSRIDMSIQVAQPTVLLRQQNSDYTLINNFNTATGRDLKLVASPPFFNIRKLSELNWDWQLDGQSLFAKNEKNPEQLTIKIPTGTLGAYMQKNLSLTIANLKDETQSAISNLILDIQ